jgi:hypothetical protein
LTERLDSHRLVSNVHAPLQPEEVASSASQAPSAAVAAADVKKWAPIEFGGPWGTGFIIVISHVLLYWVWWVVNINNGELFSEKTFSEELSRLASETAPTAAAAWLYFVFLAVQVVFAYVLPGIDSKGRADENGHVLVYRCNGLLTWWTSLALLAAITYAQVRYPDHSWLHAFSLGQWAKLSGPIMTVAVLWSDALSVFLYFYSVLTQSEWDFSQSRCR